MAAVVLEDPTILAFGTVSDLAERAGTSHPTIVRFATKLGFGGYADLQSWVRSGVSEQLAKPSQRIRRAEGGVPRVRAALEEALGKAFESLDAEKLDAISDPIVRAQSVWILSGETSMAGAHVLSSGLSMLRPSVRLVEEHTTGRDLSGASSSDTAVVFDFTRYRRNSIAAARTLADHGVTIVAITDSALSPLASLTKLWCELTIPPVGPFDSAVPAVTAAELIVTTVASKLGDSARDRIDQLERIWLATGTFLEDAPRERGGF